MEIKNVFINEIRPIRILQWDSPRSYSIPYSPPVTVNIGVPIVNVPGCIEARIDSNKNNNLVTDDPKGNVTLCDGQVPSFEPIEFEPEQTLPTPPAPLETKSPEVKPPVIPKNTVKPPEDKPETKEEVECPTKIQEAQEPVGSFIEGYRKKIVGYELIDGQCIRITESTPVTQQLVAGIPSGGMVIQTGGIAVVAATSALLAKPLADLLLKVVKPTVKKVITKISKLTGKKIQLESVSERRDRQRLYSHAVRKLKGKE